MAKEEKEEEKEYKNRVLFLRKSTKGGHLYAFNNDGALGSEVESLIVNVSDVEKVMKGELAWAKVSIMEVKEG